MLTNSTKKVCPFCFNAHVYLKLPKTEDDYFDEGLHDHNDFSSHTIGDCPNGFQLYLNTGNGEATNVEVCQWISDLNGLYHSGRWQTIAKYYPKYCPECGRNLDEFKVDERGKSFTKNAKAT